MLLKRSFGGLDATSSSSSSSSPSQTHKSKQSRTDKEAAFIQQITSLNTSLLNFFKKQTNNNASADLSSAAQVMMK